MFPAMGNGRGTGRSYNMSQYRWLFPIFVLIVTVAYLNSKSLWSRTQKVDVNELKTLINGELSLHSTNSIVYADKNKKFPPVVHLPDHERLRILVTGGSGFVGSHLVDRYV